MKVKALEALFTQEKALTGAFSVIVKTGGSFSALVSISPTFSCTILAWHSRLCSKEWSEVSWSGSGPSSDTRLLCSLISLRIPIIT